MVRGPKPIVRRPSRSDQGDPRTFTQNGGTAQNVKFFRKRGDMLEQRRKISDRNGFHPLGFAQAVTKVNRMRGARLKKYVPFKISRFRFRALRCAGVAADL